MHERNTGIFFFKDSCNCVTVYKFLVEIIEIVTAFQAQNPSEQGQTSECNTL